MDKKLVLVLAVAGIGIVLLVGVIFFAPETRPSAIVSILRTCDFLELPEGTYVFCSDGSEWKATPLTGSPVQQ